MTGDCHVRFSESRGVQVAPATRQNVKHDRIGRAGITSAEDLRAKATAALQRLVELPALVRAFFRDPDLLYITA